MIQFANKNITQIDIQEKISMKKEKSKTYILLENNQPIAYTEKTTTEFLKVNVRMLNSLSRAKYKCLQSQKESTSVSPYPIIRMILKKESLDQNYILLIKRPLERKKRKKKRNEKNKDE